MSRRDRSGWTDLEVESDYGDAAEKFVHLRADAAESQKGRMVRKDAQGRQYWFKNGRNKVKLSKACLEKYHALLVEDSDEAFYLVPCAALLNHPEARNSRSSKHGDRNPHIQLPLRSIRAMGTVVDPAQFTGSD